MGVIYPIFFAASLLIAFILWITREKVKNSASESGIGLFLKPDVYSSIHEIENITQDVDARAAGLFVSSSIYR